MVKVSVIVPVYNQEQYLRRCLDSILNQTLQEIEIILVDDGSTDLSLQILKEYESKDERIQVLTQKNQYAGVARNNGLKNATGEYVIFWDSDDYFHENALEALYLEAKTCDADICIGEAVKEDVSSGMIYKNTHYVHEKKLPDKRPFNVDDVEEYIFNIANNSPWNKLYNREFIQKNNLQFQDIKRVNDVYFVMMAFVYAKKITVTDQIIVYYQYRNSDSLSHNAVNNKEYIVKAYRKVLDELKKSNVWDNDNIKKSYINKAFSAISSQFSMIDDYEDFAIVFDYFKNYGLKELEIYANPNEKLYFERNELELSNISKLNMDQYVFQMYCYYLNKTNENKNDYLRIKDDLLDLRSRDKDLKEKHRNLKDRFDNLKEKNQKQKETIQSQKELIQKQKAILNMPLVRFAVKLYKIFKKL